VVGGRFEPGADELAAEIGRSVKEITGSVPCPDCGLFRCVCPDPEEKERKE
jgi:hypothetical protein